MVSRVELIHFYTVEGLYKLIKLPSLSNTVLYFTIRDYHTVFTFDGMCSLEKSLICVCTLKCVLRVCVSLCKCKYVQCQETLMAQRSRSKSPVHIHLEDGSVPVHVHVEKAKKPLKSSIDVG